MSFKKGNVDFKVILAAGILIILVGLFLYSSINKVKPAAVSQSKTQEYFAGLEGKQIMFENSLKEGITPTSTTDTEITIYENNNLGYVHKTYSIDLTSGTNYVTIPKISSYVDTQSISISDSDPSAAVLGQTYNTGSQVSEQQLLKDSIGKTISVKKDTQTMTGKLLSAYPIILQTTDGIVSISTYDYIIFPSEISVQSSEPSLVFAINTNNPGTHNITVTYLTSGLNWQGDYHLTIKDNTSDITAFASISNNEDVDYENATLRLVNGQISTSNYPPIYAASDRSAAMPQNAAPSPQEIPSINIYEFKAYDIPALVTLQKGSTQQIQLIDRSGVKSSQQYSFEGSQNSYYQYGSSNGIKSTLLIQNNADSGLGIALPQGRVMLYADFEGKNTYIGETSVDNTAADENITLDTGVAFDLTGKETQTDHQVLDKCTTTDTYSILLNNHKDIPVEVKVAQSISDSSVITGENYKHTPISATEADWQIPVSANSSSTLMFTLKTTDQYCNNRILP